jgi:hypothetical protein
MLIGQDCIAPRGLFRLMLELGKLTLGAIVITTGGAVRLTFGLWRVTAEVGGQVGAARTPMPLPIGA